MKKTQTVYKLTENVMMTVNEETGDHISIHDYGEPCSGIVKHWGTKKEIIKELESIITALKTKI